MTPPRVVSEESRLTLLRTTADVIEHALVQAECCAEQWPEYGKDVERFASFVKRLSGAAQQVGHKPRPRWSVPA